MKNVLIAILLFGYPLFAQTFPGDFLNADERIPDIPQSPEVAAFEKYGSLPVNLYAGSPSIAIPIYTIQGHESSLPISLTYDASGIRVDQIATNVGLGWNLNFGGVVSRNVQGHADGNQINSSFNVVQSNIVQDALDVVYNGSFNKIFGDGNAGTRQIIYNGYKDGLIDLQADTFSFNVNGLSGTLIIDYTEGANNTYAVYCVEHPDIKAEFINQDSWKITDTNGTSYFFNRAERTRHEFSGSGQNGLEYQEEYNSAWYLTKMVSPNGLDEFDLTYGPSVFWQTVNHRDRHHNTVLYYYDPLNNNCNNNQMVITATEAPALNDYLKQQFNLTSISHNGVVVLSTELNNETTNPRADLEGMRYYKKLIFKDEFTDPLLIVDFDNDHYFRKSLTQINNESNSRLKLEGVSFYRNIGTSDKKTYSFDYYDADKLASRESNAVDYWGYNNGTGIDGGPLVPETFDFPFPAPGINRDSHFFYTRRGTMKSITYPTGGKTTFTYEAHKVPTGIGAPNGVVGGLRISKQVTETQDLNGLSPNEVKYYYYGDIVADVNGDPSLVTVGLASGPDELGSGIVQQNLIFTQITSVEDAREPCGDRIQEKYYQHANNRAVQVPNAITYTHVSEVIFKGNEFIGCTVNKFYNDDYDYSGGLTPRPFYNERLLNGELNEAMTYDGDLNLVKSSVNTYENTFLGVPEGFNNYNGVYLYTGDGIDPWTGDPYTMEPACKDFTSNGFYYYSATILQCLGALPPNNPESSAINYTLNKYNYNQYHKKLLNTVSTVYEGATSIQTQSNYTYQNPLTANHYFPIEIANIDNNSNISKASITYVADLAGTTVMDTLIGRNQISEPVMVKQYYNSSLLSTQNKNFGVSGTSLQGFNKQIIRPDYIEVAKGTSALETRRTYHSFDAYGNLTEVSVPNGSRTYYIWGYNGKRLLAEIQNKPQSSIPLATQFLITNAQTTSNIETSVLFENTLRTQLDLIRNDSFFSNSLVTTYTYDPGIGVTSITDSKGYTMFYEYDEHNRLKQLKDPDSKVIGQNEYSYRVNN